MLRQIFLIWNLYLSYDEVTYHCSRFGTLEPLEPLEPLNVSVRINFVEKHE